MIIPDRPGVYEHNCKYSKGNGYYDYPIGNTYGDFEERLILGGCPEQRKRYAEKLKDENVIICGVCKRCGKSTHARLYELKYGLRTDCGFHLPKNFFLEEDLKEIKNPERILIDIKELFVESIGGIKCLRNYLSL